MLVLSRRDGEQIVVGDDVVIKVLSTSGGRVRIGIEAPRAVSIRRGELVSDRDSSHFAGYVANQQSDMAKLATLAGCAH